MARITRLETDRAELERLVTQAFKRKDHREGRRLSTCLEQLGRTIGRLYQKWEEAESARNT